MIDRNSPHLTYLMQRQNNLTKQFLFLPTYPIRISLAQKEDIPINTAMWYSSQTQAPWLGLNITDG